MKNQDKVTAISILASEEPGRYNVVAIDPPSRFGDTIAEGLTASGIAFLTRAIEDRDDLQIIGMPRTLVRPVRRPPVESPVVRATEVIPGRYAFVF